MHSSTSNSSKAEIIDYRITPDHPWRKLLLLVLVLCTLLLAGWEYLARQMHHLPGSYGNGMNTMWADERRKLDKPHNIRVVLVGSSRMLWNADLDILEEKMQTRPIQLSLPGTSPALFIKDIVDNTDFDGLLLVGYTPGLFNWFSEGFSGKDAFAAYEYESPDEWVDKHIHRWVSHYLGYLDESFSLPELMDHYIELPHREGAKVLQDQGWKLGDTYADRQTDMWAPVEEEGSFDNEQILRFWLSFGIDTETPIANEAKQGMVTASIEYFTDSIATLRARGGDIVFIRMPSSGDFLKEDILNNHDTDVFFPTMQALDVPSINTMDYPELSTNLEIPEWSHLSRKSQDEFSALIPDFIDKELQDKRGYSLQQIISAEHK